VPLRGPRNGLRRCAQQGIALLAVVALLAVGATFLLLRSLNAATWRADRYRVTQEALARAKEALVMRAVADANRPGSLPCPDTNDDGQAELFVGNACPAYIGRLPWKTLDLPDLRDGSGERLWYVLSPTHRDHAAAEPINSNTVGQLNLTGTQPAANVLAILAAPEGTLIRAGAASVQDRSCIIGTNCDASRVCTTSPAALTPKCDPFNYLDVSGGVDNAGGGNTLVAAVETQTFNDRVLALGADDVMPLVEKRVGHELAQKLREHYDAWANAPNVNPKKGFYPWPAVFTDPENVQAGGNGNPHGLLPFTPAPLVWTSASSSVGTCTGVGTSQIQCTGLYLLGLATVNGRVGNIATAFVNPPNGSEATTSGLLLLGTPTSTWALDQAAQALDFSYSVSFTGTGTVTVTVSTPAINASITPPSWLATNKWYQVVYYALSPEYAINGSGACGTCITVANTSAGNKQAVLVMTGRALPGIGQSARPVTPPAAPEDYLEGENQAPLDLAFEQNLRNSGFNDQPVVVRP
jgi:hypothetical protein